MLESIASSLLSKYLGDYVEGLDTNNLKLNLTAGDVVLKNLKLKKSALETLELPITIKNGYLGTLTLQIPWSSLGSKAAVIRIDGVYLVAGPKPRAKATADEEKVRKQQVKLQRLQLAELLGMDKPDQPNESNSESDKKKKEDGFFARMAMKVIDNVQIFLDKIHVRYEDDVSNPGHPFAFGITLDSLHAQSCNGQWTPAFLTVGEDIIHKLVNLSNLSIYFNTVKGGNATFVDCNSAQSMAEALQGLIPSSSNNEASQLPKNPFLNPQIHHFLLRPISGILKATIDRGDLVLTRPRLQLDAELDQIGIALNASQFQRAMDLLEHFSMYIRSLEFMEHRPPVDVTPQQNPKMWWNYAITCVLQTIRKKNHTWTWENIQARGKDRTLYIELYEKKAKVSLAKMTDKEKSQLEELETRYDYMDLLTFRQLANASIQRKLAAEQEKKKKAGWFSGWFGGSAPAEATKSESEKSQEEEQAMKELYQTIGYNADEVVKETVYPKDYVKTVVNFKISSSSVELRQDDIIEQKRIAEKIDDSFLKKNPPVFLSFSQKEFHVSLLMRDGSLSAVADLKTVNMTDFHTLESTELVMLQPDLDRDASDDQSGRLISKEEASKNFMTIRFDMNPLDAPGIDVRLGLKLQPVQSTLSRALIDKIIVFFERNTTRPQLSEISNAAFATWDDLRQRAQTSLKYTLEKKQKIKVDVDLAAPRFTIPKNFLDPNCPAIVLDLGRIILKSDPDARNRAISGSSQNATVSEDFFYDQFDISLAGLNAMVVGGSSAPWAKSKQLDPSKFSIINRFDLDIVLKTCTTDSPELPKMKLAGSIKQLSLDITDYRISWILDVLEALGTSTLPPKQLTQLEIDAIALQKKQALAEQERLEKIAKERAAIRAALENTAQDTDIPTSRMVRRPRKKVANIINVDSGEPDSKPENQDQQEPSSSEPQADLQLDPQAELDVLKKSLHVEFSLEHLFVTLHKTVQSLQSKTDIPTTTPLITLGLKQTLVLFDQSNHDMFVELKLDAFTVDDHFSAGAPRLIESGTELSDQEGDKLVHLSYRGVPRHSPAFKNVDHFVQAKFGTLKINLNRVTIACLMQVGTDFTNSMKQSKVPVEDSSAKDEAKSTSDETIDDKKEEEKPIIEIKKRPEVSVAKLDVSLGALILVLQKDSTPFMQFDVAKSHVDLDIKDDGVLHVSGYLGGISLLDRNPGIEWPNIISISGDKILTFEYAQFNRESVTYPGYDMSIHARMSSLRVVAVNAAIQELVVYFGAFEKMRKAISMASWYYYQASLDAVRQAAERATKIKLNIEILNPAIIVPQSSKSSRHLLLDLGRIVLHNNWEKLETGVELDVIQASISGLYLGALADPNASDFVKKIKIINESHVSATFKRPMIGNQHNTSPNVDLEAEVANIDISLTEDYMDLVFAVLSDNLSEKPARDDQVELAKVVEFLSSLSYSMEGWEAQGNQNAVQVASSDQAYLNMIVHAKLMQVSLTVYKGSGQSSISKKSTALGTFAIQNLTADYSQYSDSRMKVDLSLGAVILEDARLYSENKFRRIWAPNVIAQGTGELVSSKMVNGQYDSHSPVRLSQLGRPESMIINTKPQFSLSYSTEPASYFTDIQLELYRPRLYLIPDAIQELYEYAMDNIAKMTAALARMKKSPEAVPVVASDKEQDESKPVEVVEDVAPAAQEEQPITTMKIEIILTSPEICVVENTDKVDPVALILQLGESKMRFFMSGDGSQKLDLGVQHLDAYKCILDAEHAGVAHDIVKLLQPLSLGVNMGTGDDKIRRMAVEVGKIHSIISYNDIKLVMDIYNSYIPLLAAFSKPRNTAISEEEQEKKNEDAQDEALDAVKSNLEILESTEISSKRTDSEPVASSSNEVATTSKKSSDDIQQPTDDTMCVKIDKSVLSQMIIVSVTSIFVNLLNDRESPDYSTPVLQLTVDQVKNILSMYEAGGMESTLSMNEVQLRAYNNTLAAYEPVVEPWGFDLVFTKDSQTMGMHLQAQDMLDVNVTKSLLDTTFNLLQVSSELFSSEKPMDDETSSMGSSMTSPSTVSGSNKTSKKKKKKKRASFNPYVIKNETNVPVSIHLTSDHMYLASKVPKSATQSAKEATTIVDIEPGREAALSVHVDREEAAEKVIKLEIGLSFPKNDDYRTISKLPISRVASLVFPISKTDANLKLIAEIVFDQGCKVITLRGNHILKNQTETDIEVAVAGTSSQWTVLPEPVPAQGHLSIPIDMCNYRSLRFRPKDSGLTWFEFDSSPPVSSNNSNNAKTAKNGYSKSSLMICKDESNDSTWISRINQHCKPLDDYRDKDHCITLTSSLTVENATCSIMSFKIVNIDLMETDVVKPMDLDRTEQTDVFHFQNATALENNLNSLGIAIRIPGFAWSDPVRFAEHARWVPVKGSAAKKRLLEPLKFMLGDEMENRPLEMLGDVKVSENGSCHIALYANYWLINQTGLNLFYKGSKSSKAVEAAGQRIQSPDGEPKKTLLVGDPAQWYTDNDDLESLNYIYAQNRFFYGDKQLSVKVEDSAWSSLFPLGVQNEGMITVDDMERSGRQYNFAVVVKPAPGKFWRTKLVRLYPGFILVNKSSRTLLYRQDGHGQSYQLTPNQHVPFHWPLQDTKTKKLLICDLGFKDAWSPAFALDMVSSFQVKLRTAFSSIEEEVTIDVVIKTMKGTTFIVFGDRTIENSINVVSYAIENQSKYEAKIQQKGSAYAYSVSPDSTLPFCWDEPQVTEPILLFKLGIDPMNTTPAELSLDIIAKFPEIPIYTAHDGTRILLEVRAESTQKILVIKDYPRKAPKGAIQEQYVDLQPVLPDRVVSMQIKISMRGIGLSVVDSTPQELMYLTLQTIFADVQVSNIDQTAELKVGIAQIDNQLFLSPIPIVLYSVPHPERPFFHLTLVRDHNVKGVQFFKYFAVQLQEIDLAIHEVFLHRTLAFSKFLTDYLYAKSEEQALKTLLQQTDSEMPSINDEDLSASDMYYFELFHLNPIKVNVTFVTSIDLDAETNNNAPPTQSDQAVSGQGALEEILGYVGVLTDIERAPIELNALMLLNPFSSRTDMVNRIVKHYTLAGIKQAYKIVGSADFLGNPVSLVTNLGTGVKDFFYEPAMGIVESPAAFGKGLAKGTKSLVLKTTYAIFDTASKLTGTVAKVGAKLTMDDDYQRERAIRNQTKARHAGEGLVYGARDFGIGLFKGITGVVLDPIKGGQKEGAVGVFKGIGKGLAGIVLKPVVGAVDLVTRTTEGIKNTASDEKAKAPVRPPRYFGHDGLVRIYDYERAAGQFVLRTLDERRGKRDIYESHVILKDTIIIISKRHIFLLEEDKLQFGHKWKLDWKEKLSHIAACIVFTKEANSQKPKESNFDGVVLQIEPRNRPPRRRKISCSATQAKQIAKRLLAMQVRVKKADLAADQLLVSPNNQISRTVTGASGSDSQTSYGTAGKYAPTPNQYSRLEPNVDLDRSVDSYSILQDWKDDDPDDQLRNTFGRRNKRKKNPDERTSLLGGVKDDDSCCSCSCAVM